MLLVEDDETIRSTTAEMLSEAGSEIREAESGEEALKLLDVETVDVLLTDLTLRGISGVELAKAVRARHPNLCLILVSRFGRQGGRLASEAF